MIDKNELPNLSFVQQKDDADRYFLFLEPDNLNKIIMYSHGEFELFLNGCCRLKIYPESIEELKLFIKILGYADLSLCRLH